MKASFSPVLPLALAALLIPLSPVSAQFPPLPAADLVLGAADFDTAGSATATATGMFNPLGVAIDPTSGAVFVADTNHHRVLRFGDMDSLSNGAAALAALGQTGLTQSGLGLSATTLQTPVGVHVDASGRLWVADVENHRVLMYENAAGLSSGDPADLVLGQADFVSASPGNSATRMNQPFGVFVDGNDNLWVADRSNARVLKFASVSTLGDGAAASVVLGQVDFGFSVEATTAMGMESPVSVCVDAFGNLWVADEGGHRVLRFANASSLVTGAAATAVLGQADLDSTSGSGGVSFAWPASVIVGPGGDLWVSDTGNHRIVLFKNARLKPNGAAADRVIGQANLASGASGLGARRLNNPYGISFDTRNRIWVCDATNERVLRFTPDQVRPLLTVKKVPRTTSKAKLKIQGTANDSSGIASVRYRVGKSAYRPAQGTASWKFNAKLKPGLNKIEIDATDAAGNLSASKRVKVRRG